MNFIRRIKYFSFHIDEKRFDLMALQGGIQTFGEKYGMDQKHIYRLQICCEELINILLERCYPSRENAELELLVSHAESDGTTQISISCGGEPCNPFAQTEDGLGVTILKNMAARLDYRLENGNNWLCSFRCPRFSP